MQIRSVILVLIVVMVFSCKKETDKPIDFAYEYYPIDVGRYWVYNVDSTVYDDFTSTVKEYSYQIKEIYTDKYIDADGTESIRIERYYKKDSQTGWQIVNVWKTNRTKSDAQKVENNLRIVKLKFPPQVRLSWNGNVFNNQAEQDYEYNKINTSYVVNAITFDKAVIVQHENDSNLIAKKSSYEVYAYDVGLIEKEIIDVESKKIVAGVAISNRISKGYKLKYTLLNWGK